MAWSPLAGATSYTVYWGTHPPANVEQGTAVPNAPNPFVHSELSKGTTYYYTVVAQTAEGPTRPSAEASATPDGPISIAFVNPTPTQIVGARFVVSVEIRSVFQLTSVTAQVEDFTDELTYIPASDEWEGFFEVGDLPSPTFRTVHYTATDAAGNIARTAVLVQLDHLPVVTMSTPQDDALATPSIRVVASCTDDSSGGCESLTISVSGAGGTITKAVGQATVDQEISLAEFEGQVENLRAGGRDVVQGRIHRTPSVIRRVYVETSSHLTPVASSGTGTLIDASAIHLLAVEGGGVDDATDTLRRVERGSGQSTVIYNVNRERAREGSLFPGGVIFLTQASAGGGTLKEWRNGTVSDLQTQPGPLKVALPYAIWSSLSAAPIRRELNTGTNVTLPAVGTASDVAPNGDVALWSSAPYEVHLFQDGSATQLTNDGDGTLGNVFPVTDGAHVVYARTPIFPASGTSSIRLSASAGEIVLASNVTGGLVPGDDYEVNDGWIAFVRTDAGNVKQIWRRSPAGVESQVTVFGSSSTIEAMGPAGEILFMSSAVGTERRYRAVAGEEPVDVGAGLGRAIFIDGVPHVLMGSTLLRVD